MEKFEYRLIKENEIKDALTLVKLVFDEFEKPYYSEEGILNFYKFINENSIKRSIKQGIIHLYGAFDNGNLIGIIGTKNKNHICLLFVSKNYHKKRNSKQVVFFN